MIVLITGGARSGKSAFAEQYVAHKGNECIYVATCEGLDDEMKERIQMHQQRRSHDCVHWETLEEPYHLSTLLEQLQSTRQQPIVLVDCMTLWLSNWLLQFEDKDVSSLLTAKMDELIQALEQFEGTLLMVTNEVGDSIVPEYKLGRIYRDMAGRMNQRLAAISDQVFLVTAGIPIELKSRQFRFDQS